VNPNTPAGQPYLYQIAAHIATLFLVNFLYPNQNGISKARDPHHPSELFSLQNRYHETVQEFSTTLFGETVAKPISSSLKHQATQYVFYFISCLVFKLYR
jgi:hypothetical protein